MSIERSTKGRKPSRRAAPAVDEKLLGEIASFHRLFTKDLAHWGKCREVRAQADAHPDAPDLGPGDKAAQREHWDRYGLHELYDEGNKLSIACRRVFRSLIRRRARTHEGIIAKVAAVQRLIHDEGDWGDPVTWPYMQDQEWLAHLQLDLARLAKGGAS